MERKKRLIVLSIILASVLLIVVLSSALFRFKSASIECRTNTFVITTADHQAIIDSAEFKFGSNILFTNFNKNIENIEQKNPYVKVINIERKFPNYAVVNIRERVPAVRLACAGGGYYCVDSELKVLNVVTDSAQYNKSLNEDKLPELIIDNSANINYDRKLTSGQFIENSKLQEIVSAFYNGAVTGQNIGGEVVANSCISTISTIKVSYEEVLKCLRFDVDFGMSSSKAIIYYSNALTDNIYKIMTLFIQHGEEYSVYKCSPSGEITAEAY